MDTHLPPASFISKFGINLVDSQDVRLQKFAFAQTSEVEWQTTS